jgi:hypothetical protein
MISYNCTTKGCLSFFMILSYLDILTISVFSNIRYFSKILTATCYRVILWMASLTFPKLPLPRVLEMI